MAEENSQDQDDRTEDATPERRDEFREKGYVAVSRELSSVFILAAAIISLTWFASSTMTQIERMMTKSFSRISSISITQSNILNLTGEYWFVTLKIILPLCLVTLVSAITITFFQTKLNFSWKKAVPDFQRLNPVSGLARMVNSQALVEMLKGIGKMLAVGLMSYLILLDEWAKVPSLIHMNFLKTFSYFGDITTALFWSVAGLLLIVAAFDFLVNFMTIERKLKMTKQEVKEEFKRREVDPHVKARMRRMQRDIVMRKMLDKTKKATVVITNPTHYAVALKYEVGMGAPIVVAKGIDHIALRIREVAKEHDVPIVENKPLARTLYKLVELDQEIPDSLYKAVSEIIRYVFNIKGIKLGAKTKTTQRGHQKPLASQKAAPENSQDDRLM